VTLLLLLLLRTQLRRTQQPLLLLLRTQLSKQLPNLG
jgi:hypothetical protein